MNRLKIEVKNLTKEYLPGGEPLRAVDNVSFSISRGEFISISGRSGSGKSTLLNMIAGLIIPTSGSVFLDGQDIFALSDAELSLYRNATIGCLPQVSSVLSSLTVLDNVRIPFYLAEREGDCAARAYKLLEMVGLEKLAKRMPKRLSGGQVKRVAIARAMMNNPRFLLVDEPTGDLDAQTTQEIMRIFRSAADEGTAVLMITHDLETTEYADKRFDMSDGVLSPRVG